MDDFRYAWRMLTKRSGGTVATVLLLGIGLGATTVMFSAYDAIILRPLPVYHPEELVRVVQKTPQLGFRSEYRYWFYRELHDNSTTLAAVFGEAQLKVPMTEPGAAEAVLVGLPTPEFFDVLSQKPLNGRTLSREDDRENSMELPAVLSFSFWQRRFGRDPNVLGRPLTLRGQRFFVVGVMPSDFNGIRVETSPDVWVPLRTYRLLQAPDSKSTMEASAVFELGGRLKPNATSAQAQAECFAIWKRTAEQLAPEEFNDVISAGMQPQLDSLRYGVSILRDRFGGALNLLIGSAGLLLILTCLNIAGLLLARAARRRNEIAVRLAIGATRGRLVREMLIESSMLAAAGGAGGMVIAKLTAPLLLRALPPLRDFTTSRLSLTLQLPLDWRVFLFSLVVSGVSILLFGLVPALAAARISLDSVLRGGVRSTGRWRGRNILVFVQIALCTMLIAGAGLLAQTFHNLFRMNPGFDRNGIVTFTANTSILGYTPEQTATLRETLIERVQAIPGVLDVSTAVIGVLRGSGRKTTVAPAGRSFAPSDILGASTNEVSVNYFRTMGMHFVEGRFLPRTYGDNVKPVPVVVNQAFAKRFFPDTDPLGKLFGPPPSGNPIAPQGIAQGTYQIIGIVTDAKYRSLREPMAPTIYTPVRHSNGENTFQLLVRTGGRPESLIPPVRQSLADLDPMLVFTEIHTLFEEIGSSIALERLTAALASIFAIISALLAGVGIYSLLTYVAIHRQREFSIRVALGARPLHIGKLIGYQMLGMLGPGVLLGLASALVAGRWIRSLLYDVAPADPFSLATAAVFVLLVATFATIGPVVRALSTQPATALHEEM